MAFSIVYSTISIHALRGEGDVGEGEEIPFTKIFLSTPSVGRATKNVLQRDRAAQDFYPRPPWGGRLPTMPSIFPCGYFYPRPPWGGRPARSSPLSLLGAISIHALRGEGDVDRPPR